MHITDILITATNAVVPIILLILLGYFLKRRGFLTSEFAKVGNKLVFKVCLPVMLFVNVYNIDDFRSIQWDIIIYSVVMLVVIFALGVVAAVLATPVPERRGVLVQCIFRSNFALIGLSLAGALGDEQAVAVAAILSSFTIPVFNILAVVALTMFMGEKSGKKTSIKSILVNIIKNPMIIAVILGLSCIAIREVQIAAFGEVVFALNRETKFLFTALNNIKSIASPFALIVLGAEFEFSAVKGLRREIVVGTLWRLVLAPLIGIGGAVVLSNMGILTSGPEVYPGLIALFASPVAVSSAVMAGSMNNDQQLATQLVVWTSLFSIVTIFVWVCVMMGMGLFVV